MKNVSKTKKSLIMIMFFTAVSKVLGLLREMILASKYGTGVISDSYIVSLSIQNVLFASLSTAVLVNYIPIFSGIDNDEERKRFNSSLIGVLFIVISIIIAIFFAFNTDLLKLFVSGFDEEDLVVLSRMVSISIFSSYFLIIGYVLKGFLEYKENFLCTAVNGVLLNVGLIGGILLSSSEHYNILSFGIITGYGLNFILLLFFAIKNGFKSKISLEFKNNNVKKLALLTIPLLLNDAIWEINSIVDKSITSRLGTGYISALNYGNFIVTCFITIFITSISTIIFPKLVKNIKDNEYVSNQIKKIFKYLTIVCVPVMILLIMYSEDVVRLLFLRGNFDSSSLVITSTALKFYSVGIVFVSFKTIMFKLFYARQETKIPSICATSSIVINIILSLILINYFGYIGVIVATIIASFISSLLLYLFYRKKYGTLFSHDFIIDLVKISILNIIILVLVQLVRYFTSLLNLYYYLFLVVNFVIIGLMIIVYLYVLKKNKIEFF